MTSVNNLWVEGDTIGLEDGANNMGSNDWKNFLFDPYATSLLTTRVC